MPQREQDVGSRPFGGWWLSERLAGGSAEQQLATQASAKSTAIGLSGREVIVPKLVSADTFEKHMIPRRPMAPYVL